MEYADTPLQIRAGIKEMDTREGIKMLCVLLIEALRANLSYNRDPQLMFLKRDIRNKTFSSN